MINIINGDCIKVMEENISPKSVSVVLTSPPYNNSRACHTERSMKKLSTRYVEYDDNKTNEEYCEWCCDIFNHFDTIVKENGVVLWNVSYGNENPSVMFECVNDICQKTNWMIADVICWKKKSALPSNVSVNKLTRICEFVFVFCRDSEYTTFKVNKDVTKVSYTGQSYYSVLYNFIEADNNDGPNDLNKATFSTDFVIKLLNMYACDGTDTLVFDPFMGTGTTALGCKILGINCIGSELSKAQCDYANSRLAFNGNTRSTVSVSNVDGLGKFDWGI